MKKMLTMLIDKAFIETFAVEFSEREKQYKESLMDFLTNKNVFMRLDWSGEDNNGDIVSFLKSNISKYHKDTVVLDDSVAYKDIEKKNKKGLLEKGDAPLILFDKLERQLKKQNYQLLFYESGNDEYIFTVVQKRNFKKLLSCKEINFEGIPKDDDELQVIECSQCGVIFFPQYGDGKDVYCDCGKLIWTPLKKDDNG